MTGIRQGLGSPKNVYLCFLWSSITDVEDKSTMGQNAVQSLINVAC